MSGLIHDCCRETNDVAEDFSLLALSITIRDTRLVRRRWVRSRLALRREEEALVVDGIIYWYVRAGSKATRRIDVDMIGAFY